MLSRFSMPRFGKELRAGEMEGLAPLPSFAHGVCREGERPTPVKRNGPLSRLNTLQDRLRMTSERFSEFRRMMHDQRASDACEQARQPGKVIRVAAQQHSFVRGFKCRDLRRDPA